ncbi:hypothetical protein B0T11DRAFT_110731 [Plectosphaerella cucumerina]|uniref:Uncharacterized protein n=1 Tax=Plectosphaerella cucumerina TaxID=40658 RepID=A0A8K0TI58_9PEZI|nr:hypothetical protein B0T11DRAFT_110731 [Plectosphaerella cucumerina]
MMQCPCRCCGVAGVCWAPQDRSVQASSDSTVVIMAAVAASRGYARDVDRQTNATAGQRWGMEMMRGDGGSGTRQSRNNMMLQIPGTRAPKMILSLRQAEPLVRCQRDESGLMTRLASSRLCCLSAWPAAPGCSGNPCLVLGGDGMGGMRKQDLGTSPAMGACRIREQAPNWRPGEPSLSAASCWAGRDRGASARPHPLFHIGRLSGWEDWTKRRGQMAAGSRPSTEMR